MKYYLLRITVLLGVLTLLFSCGKEDPTQPTDVKVTGITLSSSTLEMSEGDTQTLTATISPSDATNKKVIWSSSNSSIASVDEGKVTAIKEGEATITAKSDDGGKTATCEVKIQNKNYICFKTVNSNELNFLSIENLKGTILYSNDGVDWQNYEKGNELQFGNGKSLFIKGLNNNNSMRNESIGHFVFRGISKVECTGNIMFLLDCTSPETIINRKLCFLNLFKDCTSLTKAPELPATQLALGCYQEMFSGCTSLTEAPDLPATQLTDGCYGGMFEGCTSITAAPALPAMELKEISYSGMFAGCTSLTKAPDLPATQLADYCYNSMFAGCTALTEAPELPATVLTYECYRGMFNNCISLTKAPELPATQLAFGCYGEMFSGCTSLIKVPELPATQLAYNCYSSMFAGCTALKESPEIHATQAASLCCCYMFKGCTSLADVPDLSGIQLAFGCYEGMFSGCTALTKAPDLPATKLVGNCYNEMFKGCTSLTKAPELPATQLEEADGCYCYMFDGCTSLNYVKAMFVDHYNGSANNMLSGVHSTGTFVKNKAATWDNSDIIPSGWTVELAEE